MNERLEKICFLPPVSDTPWVGAPSDDCSISLERLDEKKVSLPFPLFWYDPPWAEIEMNSADSIAAAVARLGVTVSALRRDLVVVDEESELHLAVSDENADEGAEETDREASYLPRMLPYRPERYGVSDRDFDGAAVIDVRLAMRRDPDGRFAFTPDEITRWVATQDQTSISGGSWVPAASFPPDVDGMEKLGGKIRQLRMLAPDAVVLVSISPHRLVDELHEVLKSQPDGIILRLNELDLDPLDLARFVQKARGMMDDLAYGHLPLWIVPGEISADDAVKLIQLGANAVAVDSWCRELVDEIRDAQQNASAGSGYSSYSSSSVQTWIDWVEYELGSHVERFDGLMHSVSYQSPGQRLATLSDKWAESLSIPKLNLPF